MIDIIQYSNNTNNYMDETNIAKIYFDCQKYYTIKNLKKKIFFN